MVSQAAEHSDDEGLVVRADGHPVISGHRRIIHIPLDLAVIGVASGSHLFHPASTTEVVLTEICGISNSG